jgi:hypothetical protein
VRYLDKGRLGLRAECFQGLESTAQRRSLQIDSACGPHPGVAVTRRVRIAFLVLSYVGVLAVGGAMGLAIGFDTARQSKRVGSEMGAMDWFNAHLLAERMMGDPVAYRNVLSDYLAALRARQETGGGIVRTDHVTAVDIVLTETRLAVLAESQGNSTESGQYLGRAVADCPTSWKDGCSVERLRQIVQRLDRKLPASP